MTQEKIKKAKQLSDMIDCKKTDLKNITHYEKFHSYSPIEVHIKKHINHINSVVFLRDEKLKNDVMNLIKIHLMAEIQRMEKELEEI